MTTTIANITALLTAKLLPRWRDNATMQNLVTLFSEGLQELEDLYYELVANRHLSTAVGAQLDQYGDLLSFRRNGRGDSEYRQALQAIGGLRRDGHLASRVATLVGTMWGSTTTLARYVVRGPVGFTVTVTPTISITDPVQNTAVLEDSAPVGVQVGIIRTVSPIANAFLLDTAGQGLDAGQLGTYYAPTY